MKLGSQGYLTYGVEKSVTGNLGRTARGVVDVVVLEGNQIVGTSEVHGPVSVTIASGRVVGGTVNVVVGDGDTAGRLGSEDNVLAANSGSL